MEIVKTTSDSFLVAGLKIRTMNQHGLAQVELAEMWDYYLAEEMSAKIPNTEDDDIYCVYFEYEDGHEGLYSALLGKKVSSIENLPEGMFGVQVPEQLYEVVSAPHATPEAIRRCWKYIWDHLENRTYTFDFERYRKSQTDSQIIQAQIFVATGVK